MIVAIHQPCFLPWLGYLDRMQQADLFVILDHVQFERRNYQNRTRISLDGREHWLTVPVRQLSQQERIVDKQIDHSSGNGAKGWAANMASTLRHAYRSAPFLDVYWPELSQGLLEKHDSLVDYNLAQLDFLRQAYGITTPLVRSSQLEVGGARSELILNLCLALGADTYLAGMGGSRHYLDVEAFRQAGVSIQWQDFRHPRYHQCGSKQFLSGLSAIDLLLNQGPTSHLLLLDGRQPLFQTTPDRHEMVAA